MQGGGAPQELVRQDTTLRDPQMYSRMYSPSGQN